MKVVEFKADPVLREAKRMISCPECGNRHFKIVKYERSDMVFIECTQCEVFVNAQREIDDLAADEWT